MSKLCTSIEQSKKLIELGLNTNTADMWYRQVIGGYELVTFYSRAGTFIPAWSLVALLDVLPNNENISTNLSKGGYKISTLEYTNNWFVDYEDEIDFLNNCVTSANNPVDACVAMIEKLHELNLL